MNTINRKWLLSLLFLVLITLFTWSDPEYKFLGLGTSMVQPLRSFDFSNELFVGINIRGKILPYLGAQIDTYFIRTSYFGYDYATGWYGPDAIVNIPGADSNWIFNQNEFIVALGLAFYMPIGMLQPYFITGPVWIVLVESEAADYYPEFQAYFDEYKNDQNLFLGYMAKLGLDIFFIDWMSCGIELLFKIDRVGQFIDDLTDNPPEYIRNRSNLCITLTFWPF